MYRWRAHLGFRIVVLAGLWAIVQIPATSGGPPVSSASGAAVSNPGSSVPRPLENLAFRGDAVPVARVTSPSGEGVKDLTAINDGITNESYDSYDGANVAGEDWYGYLWSEPLYFDDIGYFEGMPSAAGGHWKSLTVQYTIDGTRWIEAADVVITPDYDFSDSASRPAYSQYSITFVGCLGRGVRIYGQPGGPACFTSISELEVYGARPGVICTRVLPTSYPPEGTVAASLSLDVEAGNAPATVTITEIVPEGLTVADPGTGDTTQPGQISWTFSGGEVKSRTLDYSLAVPAGESGVLAFGGNVSYAGSEGQKITGVQSIAPQPLAPAGVQILFDVDAHLSWQPATQEGIAGYRIYRSEEGGEYTDWSGLIPGNTYADIFVEEGKSYQYKVVAQNTTGAQSVLEDSDPTEVGGASMTRRHFEDYDFEGGSYPGGESKHGFSAGYRSDLDMSDFFYQDASQTNEYRPADTMAIPAFNAEERFVGGISAEDWWKYTFDVPEEGYVKIGAIRAASEGPVMVEFLWDESHKGWFSFETEGINDWQIFPVDTPAFHSTAGEHTLRIIISNGSAELDYFGIGFQQPAPSRVALFADDFESYTSTEDITSGGGWTIYNGSGIPDGAWQLWSTTGSPLGYESPDLPSMMGQYVISDGEFAGPGDLDEQLISPVIDCRGYVDVTVQFGSNIKIYEWDIGVYDQVYDLDIATQDEATQSWSGWTNVFHHEGVDGDDPLPKFVDIAALADGKVIKLRWRFWKANYDYWWAVDNVRVTGEAPAVGPGKILSAAITGQMVSLSWEAFGSGSYRVQFADTPSAAVWSDVAGTTWPTAELQWSGDDVSVARSRFYRVVSE
jgi:hypothetical protein